jgi:hypothetical protein
MRTSVKSSLGRQLVLFTDVIVVDGGIQRLGRCRACGSEDSFPSLIAAMKWTMDHYCNCDLP